jgi:hypothetical protein
VGQAQKNALGRAFIAGFRLSFMRLRQTYSRAKNQFFYYCVIKLALYSNKG